MSKTESTEELESFLLNNWNDLEESQRKILQSIGIQPKGETNANG